MSKEEIEQHIVINDLLSFIACKMKNCNKGVLLRTIKNFYPESQIDDAQNVLTDILPCTNSTEIARNALKNRNKINGLYECLLSIPKEDTPYFVCRNLNNIPTFDDAKPSKQLGTFKMQQKVMESELSSISEIVSTLKEQIDDLDNISLIEANPTFEMEESSNTKKRIKLDQSTKKEIKKEANVNVEKSSGLARLQKLIDQEADQKLPHVIGDEPEENVVSDWEDDMDFENVAYKDDEHINYEVLQQNPDADDSESSKIIIVSPNFDEKDENVSFAEDSAKQFKAEKSMVVSSEVPSTNIRPVKNRFQCDSDTDNCADLRRPYIIVENGFDENIGNFLVYRCSLCNFASNDEHALPEHYCKPPHPVPTDPQRYTCKFCDFIAEHARSLNEHLVIHRKVIAKKEYNCVLCYFDSSDATEYKNHLRSHRWKRPYSCDLCDFRSNDQSKLRKHSYWHLEYKGPEHHECLLCGKVCGSANALDKHKQMHSRQLQYECLYCGISFHTEGKLYTHVLTHTKEKSFVCKYCDHATDSLHYLIHHETGHLRDKKVECHVCGEIFSNRSTLKYHIQNEHKDLKSYKCDVCSEPFASESDARMHRKKAHDTSAIFMCDFCMRTYKDEEYFKRHLAMHQQETR